MTESVELGIVIVLGIVFIVIVSLLFESILTTRTNFDDIIKEHLRYSEKLNRWIITRPATCPHCKKDINEN